MFGRVTFPSHDLVFDVFTLLIADFQRTSIWSDYLDLQFSISAIKLGVGRMVGNAVLVTNVASNVAENLGKFPLKPGLVKASAGHAREGIQLIVGLQIIHIADGDSHSMGVARAAVCFTIIP